MGAIETLILVFYFSYISLTSVGILDITALTVFNITRRVSDWIRPQYEKIWREIRKARVIYVDETGIKVNGKKYWIWVFVTDHEVFIVIRKSRGTKVLKEVLARTSRGG